MFDPLFVSVIIFICTIAALIIRPFGVNESVPVTLGAIAIVLFGIVNYADIINIVGIVHGAAITILSTIVMSIVLESVGFFKWAAYNLAQKSKGSGILLFWYINALCFLMTMFFNNDGSILITTPIIIQTLNILKLKPHQKIPYLLSGALIATGASAPIGVSNLANLIAMKIVGIDLNSYATMMLIPSMVGLFSIAILLLYYFRKDIPNRVHLLDDRTTELLQHVNTNSPNAKRYHPFMHDTHEKQTVDWQMFIYCIGIVILTRISFFIVTPLGISTELPAIFGAIILIIIRWIKKGIGPVDIIKKTPWHIILFAFSIYLIVYGLNNAGLIDLIISMLKNLVSESRFNAIFIMGFLLTAMSNLFNNLPSVMLGTLTLTEMNLDPHLLHAAYFANIIGADIGALILPMGTLASLIWFHILRKNKIRFTWKRYLKATIAVIPISLVISLLSLYVWLELIY